MRTIISSLGNMKYCLDINFRKRWPHFLLLTLYVSYLTYLHLFCSDAIARASLIFESFLVYFVYYIFLFTSRDSWTKYLSASLPLVTLYFVSDYYFSVFGSAFKVITVKQVSELLQVANLNTYLLLAVIMCIVPAGILLTTDFRNWRRLLVGLAAVSLVYTSVEVWPSAYLDLFSRFSGPACLWSDIKSITDHGRLSMLLYWEAQRIRTLQALKSSKVNSQMPDDSIAIRNLFNRVGRKRNVHIVVLEGFFDLSRLKGIKLSKPAMHPRLMKLFGEITGVSRSPVFGGHTAQAEFEILTGVPAFADYGDIEFNLFNGGPTYSLPKLLHGVGYRTYATNAFKPEFFNEDVAYRGLGFENINFPKAYSKGRDSYLDLEIPKKEQNYIFDGDLLTRNLHFIERNRNKSPDAPVFNYILGVYGHYPFSIDYTRRPKTINAEVPAGFDKKLIEMLANQLYYRSEAVACFLEKLKALDPEAIVVIVGDHLPNLEPVGINASGYEAYSKLGYLGTGTEENSHYPAIMALNAGRPVMLHNFKHYYIPELVLDLLTNGEYAKYQRCYQPMQKYHGRYTELMRRAVE